VVPGRYTLRLIKGDRTIETKLDIGLDRRAPFTVADRRAQFDAAIVARAVFEDMSGLTERLDTARQAVEARIAALPQGDALAEKLRSLGTELEEAKKKIVATKEGGAVTGEERIREHLDILYGAFMSWEGRPTRYQIDRLDVLRRELGEAEKGFDRIVASDVKALDSELKGRKLDPIPTVADAHAEDDEPVDAPAVAAAARCAMSHGAACEDVTRAAQARSNAGERD
jgi:hypothetical protein